MEKFVIHPIKNRDSVPYWDYLKKHEVHLQKCEDCGKYRFPPYPSCPYCGQMGGKWLPISGRGVVFSWIVVHQPLDPALAADVPFVVVYVDLEEGPRVVGRLKIDKDKVKIGMPVIARYEDVDDELTLLNFDPV